MPSTPLSKETVWFEKHAYEDAEQRFHKVKLQACTGSSSGSLTSLADDIARVRQHIKNSLQCPNESCLNSADVSSDDTSSLSQRMKYLETESQKSNLVIEELQKHIKQLEDRILALEKGKPKDQVPSNASNVSSSTPVKKDDDDDVDLFGSDDEDEEEKEKLKQERLKAYEEKKSKKPALIAKSNIILDVKPWDDETDMKEMERKVRNIHFDGLVWGASKLVPLAYGIHKLQISCVVEDEKVSIDLLQEQIEGIEEQVQSMDIAAFNKV